MGRPRDSSFTMPEEYFFLCYDIDMTEGFGSGRRDTFGQLGLDYIPYKRLGIYFLY